MNWKFYVSSFAALLLLSSVSMRADDSDTPSWQKFVNKASDNVLLDFSTAGYDHGQSLPPEWTVDDYADNGYTLYNICDYGAIADDELSDKAALTSIINIINNKSEAKAVIYFPKGRFILHAASDDVDGPSPTIMLNSGYVVFKGAGADSTTLAMTAPMQPTDATVLYSSPTMLTIKNNGGNITTLANVTSKAKANEWKVCVDDVTQLSADQWVCLYLLNTNADAISAEIGSRDTTSLTNLQAGVEVTDYHQIDTIIGDTVYFKEPIMKDMRDDDDWVIRSWKHYSSVGVEDLSFEGQAKDNFVHHGSWQDDGAYKPLLLMRLVNSWVRRVNFKSVSEAITFDECANVSCYDVDISGNRGHSAIRLANTSRGFIGCVYDHSDGYATDDVNFSTPLTGLGQYHAVGVSKHSMGSVIWRCRWGDDACFESHATQPRASLFDVCEGAFLQYHMGGDRAQLPNHLDNLTIWNFNCTKADSSPFVWWYDNGTSMKVMPPTIVGMHGEAITWYDTTEMKLNENEGVMVTPTSLYEAQLEQRLGSLPSWVSELKATDPTTGIESVLSTDDKTQVNARKGIYGISGQKMNGLWENLPKGVYIVDGKKIIK